MHDLGRRSKHTPPVSNDQDDLPTRIDRMDEGEAQGVVRKIIDVPRSLEAAYFGGARFADGPPDAVGRIFLIGPVVRSSSHADIPD